MENWNITKRDLEQITRMQVRIDRLREKYYGKYGTDREDCPVSDIARCLDQAVAAMEEIIEHTS